jgi:membrane-bound metal-dependent hydrolase YbcI (DUF457 family)
MYLLFLREITLDYFFLAIFFSILPDLDIFLAPLKRVIKSDYLEHRGGSHSYIIGIMISFIIAAIRTLLTQQSLIFAWIVGMSFYGLHVSMDLLTTTKIPYLFPFSKVEHCFYIEKAGSFFTFINSIIFLTLPWFFFWFNPGIIFMQIYINSYTFLFLTYYFYRIISKVIISRTLEGEQKFLPGLLPFYYKLYSCEISGNEIEAIIKKKSHFSKKSEVLKINEILSNEERICFDNAIELNKNNYYFAKWTLFPTIIRKDGIFTVRFFFLETMMRTRSMYIQFSFDLETQAFIGAEQSSKHIQINK